MNAPDATGSVLLVDDDPDILYTVRLFLELDGHRVRTASNVNEALVALDSEPIDVVVTDLVLPGLSGLDLLTALRSAREEVEVVLVTGHADVTSATDALRQRAFDYLHKPVTGTAIRATVRRALEAARSRAADRRAAVESRSKLESLSAAVEQRTAELLVSEERYRHLVESLPALIVEIDVATGRFTYTGGALVAPLLERLGGAFPVPWHLGVHPEDRARVEDLTQRVASGEKMTEPLDFRVGTEERGYVHLRAMSVRGDSEGRLACVTFDVTEQRQAELEKERLEAELAAARAKLETTLLGELDLQVGASTHRVERAPLARRPQGESPFSPSPPMRRIEEVARLASEHVQPVLILGETGTGKGVVARYIHERSGRGPFVSLNCSSLRGEMLDSELFGHVRGAFTSAIKDRRGLVEEADSGTLFLDEIGETTPDTQARLLKLLEERTFRRVGETRERSSDFRLVCATNRDLVEEAASGRFRRDLLYRINLFTLELPPLRERPGEIRWMAERLLASLGADSISILPETYALLDAYRWPGNVRELRNAIIRATLLARGRPLEPSHFLEIAQSVSSSGFDAPRPVSNGAPRPVADDAAVPSGDERAAILALLDRFDGNRAKVARTLGVSRTTLYKKLRHFGIDEG